MIACSWRLAASVPGCSFAAVSAFPVLAEPTRCSVTLGNCGRDLTVTAVPQRVVSMGQGTTEMLLSLVVQSNEEWPLIGWEAIATANPDMIVLGTMDRRRFASDDVAARIKFLEEDPVAQKLEAVKQRRFVMMDAQSMNPTIRMIDGIEVLAAGLKQFGLTN